LDELKPGPSKSPPTGETCKRTTPAFRNVLVELEQPERSSPKGGLCYAQGPSMATDVFVRHSNKFELEVIKFGFVLQHHSLPLGREKEGEA